MSVLISALFFLSSLTHAASLVEGMGLINQGQVKEGYSLIEESFLNEKQMIEKGRLAYILAFASTNSIKASSVYYGRFALKYHPDLLDIERNKLKLKVADSFMELSEFKQARQLYQELLKSWPAKSDYINYQMGYYHLNQSHPKKANELWMKLALSSSEYSSPALKSLGRYWESLGFPGEVEKVFSKAHFLEGFSVSVDERNKELTQKDLNIFAKNNATPDMITLLIEKNPLFMKGACDFVKWYDPKLSLPNSLVFPFLQKCIEKEPGSTKVTFIGKAQASSKEEKSFIISVYRKQGLEKEGCDFAYNEVMAGEESFLSDMLTMCPEKSVALVAGIKSVLGNDKTLFHPYLKGSRVLRSTLSLSPLERTALMEIVSEEAVVQEFLSNEESFLALLSDNKLSDESLLKFIIQHKRSADKAALVEGHIKSNEAKSIMSYLISGNPYEGNACLLPDQTSIKIALESKIISQSFTEIDASCVGNILQEDKGLALLSIEKIIHTAPKVEIGQNALLKDELLNKKDVAQIPSLETISNYSSDWGKDVEFFLDVQNLVAKSISSSEGLLVEMKKLKRIRTKFISRTWSSRKIAEKTSLIFNSLLDSYSSKNESTVGKLNLNKQFNSFISSMRFP